MKTTILDLNKVIHVLEGVKKRKGMYFIESIQATETFLTGFYTALIAADVPVTWDSWRETLRHRGWRWDSCGVVPSMQAKGLTDQQIMDELIESIVEELRRVAAESSGT